MSAFLDPNQTIPVHTTIGSTRKLRFLCTVCREQCMRAPRLARRQTMTCKVHSNTYHNWHRQKYVGPIPLHVRRPIRAGLLLGVNRKQLCDVIVSLDSIKDAEDPVSLATNYIECIAQYDRVCLADSCFWGAASGVRIDGVHVPHKKKQKAAQASDKVSAGDLNADTHAPRQENPPHTNTEMGQLTEHPAKDHMWDDVLQAIHEDPRAFWGLWSTVIAPRLGPGVPQTYKEKEAWTGSNVNITEVIYRLSDLGRRLADLIADNKLIIGEAEASMYRMILRNINDEALRTPGDEQLKELKCTIGIILYVNTVPKFVYAMPVD